MEYTFQLSNNALRIITASGAIILLSVIAAVIVYRRIGK